MIRRDMEKNAQRLDLLNKKAVKWTAVLTAFAVSVSLVGCTAKQEEMIPVKDTVGLEITSGEKEDTLMKAVYQAARISSNENAKIKKEETVYGILNADGSIDHVIVNNWLKNFKNADSLTVNSELSDITNVNGNETFTENSDGTITWKTEGKDIYYQGNTQKELPISMKVTYYLDDKEIKPEELKGKSGKVRIHYEYKNLTENTITVDKKNEKISIPFLVVTGMILPADTFSNVEMENAEIISDGSNQIVIGYALPGLQESLGISDDTLADISENLTIPDSFEITADVQNFSMNMTLTMVTNQLFVDKKDDINDILDEFDKLSDDMDDLQDGSTKLVDGSEELYDGTADLNDGAKELDGGVKDLKSGTEDLKSGAKKLNDGAGELESGSKELENGAEALKSGASKLDNGAKDLKEGTNSLKEGLDTLNDKSSDLTEGIGSLTTGIEKYTEGVSSLKDGADILQAAYEGENGAVAGAKALADGTKTLYDTVSNFSLDASSLNIDVNFDVNNLVDPSALENECTKAAAEYLKENNIDPTTEEGQAIIKAFTAGSTVAMNAVSSAIATTISTQKDTIAKNVSEQIKKQIGEKLSATMTQLGGATKQLSEGASALSLGVQQLYAGTSQLSTGIMQLDENSAALLAGTKTLKTGWSQYAAGVKSANKGAKTLLAGTKTLANATSDLFTGTVSLYKGAKTLNEGTVTLKDGTSDLFDGTKELSDGVTELKDGTTELYNGTIDLKDGAKELMDGMKELDKEGIQKLTDMFHKDMEKYVSRMRGLLDVAEDYDSFTGSMEDMENSVKFILKTAEISNDEEE